MSHASVLAAIAATGGRVVASFELDEDGQTIGADRHLGEKRLSRCSACGERGHTIKRCNGPGVAPRPTYDQRRRAR